MVIKKLAVGPLESNCFIIADENTKEVLVIDPGDEPDRILDLINENNYNVKYIVCTHAHFDHVGAVPDLKKETGAKIVIHRDESEIYKNTADQAALWGYELDPLPEPDMLASEGDKLEIGDLIFEIIHTPGHSPGGICLYGEGILIAGDTLFAGSVGRTDFYGGDMEKLKSSFKRLMSLSDEVRVLPGHGPESTIGKEKSDNFFSCEI
ncbi:MAG: MBL fold metallo-hydrolase [Thermodesulfovibrio sp. RBG_19FT_COMBO_42_12]|nr:MAG: MBL fold metallo-hydrolase [Thermodesulfovibrio sp. RBG_19FT_COMBO_42_12]